MRDDQHARSPDRGRDREANRDSRHARSRDRDRERDRDRNYYHDDHQPTRQGKDTARALIGD
ncbi:hypothetical protein CFAM422_009460 [Trichoderma lentiforme]|uniref:Uncharacterized protein n=1 Tax=Trichoderma lentiforme TaxID=1567552 RepID=A0A9P4XAE6_9HYPO|nr:hypothetical protein CFAM422_009460 [Trichoderma lentiforme]